MSVFTKVRNKTLSYTQPLTAAWKQTTFIISCLHKYLDVRSSYLFVELLLEAKHLG